MQITVQVSDKMRRQAESQGLPIVDFYAMLISRGMESMGSSDPSPGTPSSASANSGLSAMARALERVRTFRRANHIAED
jgi:hypothetical protein